MRFANLLLILFALGCLIMNGCEKDEKPTPADKSLTKPVENADSNDETTSEDADKTNTNNKNEIGKIDNTKTAKNEEIDVNEISKNILPPEIETPIVNGFRVNVFAERKIFKLGNPMNIYTVVRNKSFEMRSFKTKHNSSQECYFKFNIESDKYPSLKRYKPEGEDTVIRNIISPNAVFCYVNDIQDLFIENQYVGKFKLSMYLHGESFDNSELIKSNTIEFEVVEELNEKDEKNKENVYTNVLPPEIETPIIKGLRVNVFAEKKKYKLGEPMNIFIVLRNKSDKMIKLNTKYYSSQNCYFDFFIHGENCPPLSGFATGSGPTVVENNISPNAVFCYVNDITHLLTENKYTGKFHLQAWLRDEIEGNDVTIKSNEIEFKVVEELDEIEENKDANINESILPPEIETPIIKGLRVNVFAEKKKYKLGEPMNIFIVLRNKSDKMIKLNTKYNSSKGDNQQNCYFSLMIGNKDFPLLTGYDSPFRSSRIEINLSPNATYCFRDDIHYFFSKLTIGKFKLYAFLLDEIEGNDVTIKSNEIEFEVVKSFEDGEESNGVNKDVLPPEIDSSSAKGLTVNVFAEKKKFKLGEPMNILVVLRNKSNKMIKRTLNIFRSSRDNRWYCGFSYAATNDKGYLKALTDSGHSVTTINIPPNGVYCYKVDIQGGFNINHATGRMNLNIIFYDKLIEPVSIDIEVTK